MTVTDSFVRGEFISAFRRVWDMSVGLCLEDCGAIELPADDTWATGVVWIGGSWKGCVTIMMPSSLAKEVAGRMIEESPLAVDRDQYPDAVKELTNMTAGNLKSSLAAPSALAVPGYVESDDPPDLGAHFSMIISLRYSALGFPLVAEVHGL